MNRDQFLQKKGWRSSSARLTTLAPQAMQGDPAALPTRAVGSPQTGPGAGPVAASTASGKIRDSTCGESTPQPRLHDVRCGTR